MAHRWPLAYFENSLVDPVRYPQDPKGPFTALYSEGDFAGLKPYALPGDEVVEYQGLKRFDDRRYLCLFREGRIIKVVEFTWPRVGWRNEPPSLIYNSASSRY
jgi:hypothetical protein